MSKKLFKRILEAPDNESVAIYINSFFLRALTVIVSLGIVAQLIYGLFVFHTPLVTLTTDVAVFFSIGITAFVLSFTRFKKSIGHLWSALLYTATFLYSFVRFYSIIGEPIWAFAFILILVSIAQHSRYMLAGTTISILGALCLARFLIIPASGASNLSTIIQFALFCALYFIASFIFNINFRYLSTIDAQSHELDIHINERKKIEDENTRLALYDHLTGLPNRMYFVANLHYAVEMANKKKSGLYVMFIDIDYFKRINDTLGHALGDKLLIGVGERLASVFRSNDSVCRVGGDEFLIMLREVNKDQDALTIARRILKQFSTPFVLDQRRIIITCSIGIAKLPEGGNDVEALIKNADYAMYKAKEEGKNRIKFYTSALERHAEEETSLFNSLQSALDNNEFVLYYQPQIDAETKNITGYEALLRWNRSGKGIVMPNTFIPLAEKTGLMTSIGEWVLNTACLQNKQWQDSGLPKVPVAVNISAVQAMNDSLYRIVRNALKNSGLPPEYLELEITESVILSSETALKQLEKIKSIGVKLAIDDFGTGYSTIQYLKSFLVDRIKIPMNFVRGIRANEKDESIISVILALANYLKVDVVAEGVETEYQYNFLKEHSCQTIQGFLFYQPAPADKIPDIYNNDVK